MMTATGLTFSRRLLDAAAMLVVSAVSLLVLLYVAFGESRRTYERFQVEKLISQGQVAQSVMDGFLRPGLPIHQFVGFNPLIEPMVVADPLLDAISAHDVTGERIFVAGSKEIGLLGPESSRKTEDGVAEVRTSAEWLQVILPLRNRFEDAGFLVLTTPRDKVAAQVEDAFRPLAILSGLASLLFAGFVLFSSGMTDQSKQAKAVAFAFMAKFVGVAIVIVGTMISIYSQGAQSRAKSIADSLGQRLDDVVNFNLNFDDFVGIIPLFGEYKRLNPDIRAAALIVEGKVRAHTDPKIRGTEWMTDAGDFEYSVSIVPPGSVRKAVVTVAMPKNVVYRQVLRSVKNFSALFVASGLIAALFMGVARSLQSINHGPLLANSESREKATLDLVRPVFFLAVFVEHLNYAFLPQLMHEQAASSGFTSGYATLPFLAYYFFFALSLVPAGRMDDRVGPRSLIIWGMALAAAGIILLSIAPNFEFSIIARSIAGLGQGTLFIGVQSYVLKNSSTERKTRGGAAIVFGFQAGMVAGMAIGSLLVSYITPSGVFQLGALIAVITTLYSAVVLPRPVLGEEVRRQSGLVWRELALMMKDVSFLKTMVLIGVPAKAVLTGVVLFALPLLLTNQGYAKEDIGQITMIYAAAVIFASNAVAQYADRTGETGRVLFYGGILTAAGLGTISLVGMPSIINWSSNTFPATLIILAGVIMVGLAHGLVNAPVVTHVAETRIAASLGAGNVAATYRLVERFGHMLGPVIMGQIFIYFGLSWAAVGFVGLGIFILSVLFPNPAAVTASSKSNQTVS
jgi:MFS family permease